MKYDTIEERYEERKKELVNATRRLEEALQEQESDLAIDGTKREISKIITKFKQ